MKFQNKKLIKNMCNNSNSWLFFIIKMGCITGNQRSSSSFSIRVHKKLDPKIIPCESTSSIHFSSKQSNSSSECLKFQILSPSPKMCRHKLNLSGTQLYNQSLDYIADYEFIKGLHSTYSFSQRNFCNSIHEACVNNFRLPKGIFIMMVSLSANQDLCLSYLKEPPYVYFTGQADSQSLSIFQD